jgi:hypothetical protein
VRESLEQLLRAGVANFTNHDGPGPCFVTQGPLAGPETSDKTKRYIAHKRSLVEVTLRKRFDRAVEEGELSSGVSTESLARFYSVVLACVQKPCWQKWTPPALRRLLLSLKETENTVRAEKDFFLHVVDSPYVN